MLHREWVTTGRIRFGRFYLRRFKRLTPALALMVAVTMLGSVLLLSPLVQQPNAAKTAIGAMLLGANYAIARTTGGYFDAPAATNPLLNTWSLSVEEQFYLAFPAILAVCWLCAGRQRILRFTPIAVVASVGLLSFALTTPFGHMLLRTSDNLLGFYSPLTRAWEFAVGAIIALAGIRLTLASSRTAAVLAATGLVLLIVSLSVITDTTPFPSKWTLLPVAGTALLILAGNYHTNPVSRVLSSTPMVQIGDLSYSIYLWHWPFIVFTALLFPNQPWALTLSAIASLAPSIASYHWVEQPIRNLQALSLTSNTRLLIATLTPPLAISAALLFASSKLFWLPNGLDYKTAVFSQAASAIAGCSLNASSALEISNEDLSSNCIWNKNASGPTIYLVGDSNAEQFSDALIGASKKLERPLAVKTVSACPFLNTFIDRNDINTKKCRDLVNSITTWLKKQKPGTIIISNSNSYWDSPNIGAGSTINSMSRDQLFKNRDLQKGLEEIVQVLQSAGHTVVLVQPVPKFIRQLGGQDPTRCPLWKMVVGNCAINISEREIVANQRNSRDAINRAASSTKAQQIDLFEWFCTHGICSTTQESKFLYRDGSHISVTASKLLTPLFAGALAFDTSVGLPGFGDQRGPLAPGSNH